MNWLAKLEKTKKELEKTIDLERKKLLMEKEMVSFQVTNLEKKLEEIENLENELEEYKNEKEEIRKLEEELVSKKQFLESLFLRIEKIKKSNEEMDEKSAKVNIKLSLLEDPEPFCPICLREMRYDQKVNIKAKLSQKASQESELSRRNLEQLEELERKRDLTDEALKETERKILAKPLVLDKVSLISEKIADIKKEAKKLKDLEKREQEISLILNENAYSPMAQKLLKEVNKEIRKNL